MLAALASLWSLALLGTAASAQGRAAVALGAYLPGADRHPARIDSFARRAGFSPRIVHTYKTWGKRPFEPRELGAAWRRRAVPMITWEPWGARLLDIARGHHDRYLRAAAAAAARWGRPILLRFAHEMNGDWYPWGRRTAPRVYKAAWRHLVRVFRARGARNVRWVWTPYVDPGWGLPFRSRYPGDRWVDWVGLDGMNWGGSSWQSFRRLFGSSYRTLRRLSAAPIMLAEVGCGEVGGSKAAWVRAALDRVVPGMRRVRAVVWWSKADSRGDLRVDSSVAARRALRRSVRRPLYQGALGALLPGLRRRR